MKACMSAERAGDVSLLVVLYFPPNKKEQAANEKDSESLKLLNLYKQKYPDLSLRLVNDVTWVYCRIKQVYRWNSVWTSGKIVLYQKIFDSIQGRFTSRAGTWNFWLSDFHKKKTNDIPFRSVAKNVCL